MIYHPLTAEQKPYDVRIWHCDGFKEHWHSNMDIYVCLQGQLDIRVEGADHHLTPGDTLFVASNEIHEIFCQRTDTYVLLISFGYSLLGRNYAALQSVCFDRPFFHLADHTVPDEIRIPLEQIRILLQSPDQAGTAADWALCSCLRCCWNGCGRGRSCCWTMARCRLWSTKGRPAVLFAAALCCPARA